MVLVEHRYFAESIALSELPIENLDFIVRLVSRRHEEVVEIIIGDALGLWLATDYTKQFTQWL